VVAGEERRAAFPLRDGGTLLVSADLPQMTERRVREPVVKSVGARLRVGRDREGMGSVVER
jgi:hypothetical protein